MVLIAMKSIKVQANVVYHPYASEALTGVAALAPQNRLIKITDYTESAEPARKIKQEIERKQSKAKSNTNNSMATKKMDI